MKRKIAISLSRYFRERFFLNKIMQAIIGNTAILGILQRQSTDAKNAVMASIQMFPFSK